MYSLYDELESGKDRLVKVNNANIMNNEVIKLQHFMYTIDDTHKNIEHEFDTTK